MKKKIILSVCIALFIGLCAAVLFIPFFEVASEEPMIIACFSDPHHDYGIQDSEPYIRPSTQKAVDYVNRITNGGADLVLVGGDITGRFSVWTDESIKNTMDASFDVFKSASKNGDILLVTGNHDSEPTVHSDTMEINSNDYSKYVESAMGAPSSTLYSSEIEEGLAYPFDDELLCYRYNVGNIEFLCINTPQGDRRTIRGQVGDNGLYIEQVEWVENELKSIGKDKTTFILCHYPVDYINTVTSPILEVNMSTDNPSRVKMQELMAEYSNVIYCYGHLHSETIEVLAETDEVINPIIEDNDNSAISCYMGSLGYYKDFYNPGNLGKEDPKVIQVMMIYIYSDRIEFAVHNTGEMPANLGEYDLVSYSLSRDMSAQLTKKESLFSKIFG